MYERETHTEPSRERERGEGGEAVLDEDKEI